MINLYVFNETRRGAVYGVGTYVRELITVLKKSDISVCVINIASDKTQIETEEIDGVSHWYIPRLVQDQRSIDSHEITKLYYRNIVYLLQLHIVNRNNLIFQLNYNQHESLVIELKAAFDCKIVSVLHFNDWGFKIYDNLQRLRNILNNEYLDSFSEEIKKTVEEEIKYYSKVDRIICLSNYMKEILCQDYEVDETKISTIANGLFSITDPILNKKMLRKKWNISPKEKIVLFVGRVDEVKGVNYLIKAFNEVLKIYNNCRLLIVGSGEYNLILKEAKNICTRITFTGLLERKELYEIYQVADVGVVPSLFEPFGYVPVEMMMHKLPIVATATSGLNEVVDDSCGLKIPIITSPDSVEIDIFILAQKILFLLENPEEAKRLGRNGRKRYLERFSSQVFRSNMLALYQSLFQIPIDE